MKLDNRWVKAEGSLNELPIIIHSRENWQEIAADGTFPICIQIAWNCAARDDSNAFPSQQEMQKIEVFHHQLQLHVEASEHAMVVMVITHDGINQWVIYSDDIEQFKVDLANLIAPEQGLSLIHI